jgi:hypothetical protein
MSVRVWVGGAIRTAEGAGEYSGRCFAVRERHWETSFAIHLRKMFGSSGVLTRPAGCGEARRAVFWATTKTLASMNILNRLCNAGASVPAGVQRGGEGVPSHALC